MKDVKIDVLSYKIVYKFLCCFYILCMNYEVVLFFMVSSLGRVDICCGVCMDIWGE